MRSLKIFLTGLCCILPLLVLAWTVNLYFYAAGDWYAEAEVLRKVTAYMHEHDGEWPVDWNSLRPYYGPGFRDEFERYQRRIHVDFGLDTDHLRQMAIESDDVPFRVIYPRWTFPSLAWGAGIDANNKLYRYFRLQAGMLEAPAPQGGWSSRANKQLADEWYRRGFFIELDDAGNLVCAWTHLEGIVPTDEDIAHLHQQAGLVHLNLVGASVSDNGLRHLVELPNLKFLELSDGVSDAGVDHLLSLSRLPSLDISGSEISDSGFLRLRELPRLKSLRFGKKITESAIMEFRDSRPDVELIYFR